ncbi:heterokaryon incompatibility protein-domain-containing protein [Rhexocercosporidium sp. MPI-PUGE-AT-0058]|nr:heterokaryon incompatibility protein-domain-containing protein [Rhexocercosporidium sp. MPI-PUGE-AT-0058]
MATATSESPSELKQTEVEETTTRRIPNDYTAYKEISIEPGHEQIRLLTVLPSETDDEEEQVVCALLLVPPEWADGIIYTALSYCWGDLNNTKEIGIIHQYNEPEEEDEAAVKDRISELEKNLPGTSTLFSTSTSFKQKFTVTATLYDALKSFRKAAARIREQNPMLSWQPLWVDAICINQGNIKERNSQVSMMGKIYSKAWCVWVWLGESKDVKVGLDLIVQMTRWAHKQWGDEFNALDPTNEQISALFQNRYKLFDENLGPEGCFRILGRFFAHPYFRRVWVLQEATVAAERTFVHTSATQVPWDYLVVADRFQEMWRRIVPLGDSDRLPIIWSGVLRDRLKRAKRLEEEGIKLLRFHDDQSFEWSLYWLFINTYEEFDATDMRDKLFALLDMSVEAAGSKKMALPDLAPDYSPSNSASRVFRNFTKWCIADTGDLDVLSLLSGGPRRLLPTNDMISTLLDGKIPHQYLDARNHPSWAIWPEQGAWAGTGLAKVQSRRKEKFDLYSTDPAQLFDLATHPRYKVPDHIRERLLALGGHRIGVVKSNFQMPIRVVSRAEPLPINRKWRDEELEREMSKFEKDYEVLLTSPYSEGDFIEGGLIPLWTYIQRDHVAVVQINNQVVPVKPQSWLGIEGGRYQGRIEVMFRDFLETLLLSPIYRGDDSRPPSSQASSETKSESLFCGPWDDRELGTAFAISWAASGDPQLEYLPLPIAQHLRSYMFETGFPLHKSFPHLFAGHGKGFFITEDEHMGLCSQDVVPGDIIVALPGSAVPFILHPLENEPDLEGESWLFEGDEDFKKSVFRFMGECYLHERMSSEFLGREKEKVGPAEVFLLC